MCIIDRKTYLHSDGRRETVETPRRCPRAVGSHLCRQVERRTVQQARIVERSPLTSTPSTDISPADSAIVTDTGRVYQPLSKRSSNSSSVRRSFTMSDRSTVSTRSSASSPSNAEVKPSAPPRAPTPPPASSGLPFRERTRAPYPPPLLPPEPGRIVTSDGTAIYDRPPSLELPRADINEQPSSSSGDRRSSVSSTQAEVDDIDELNASFLRRRPSIKIDTTVRPSTSSSPPSVESPGLSNLPKVGSLRRDSGKEVPRRESRKVRWSDNDPSRRSDKDRRRRDDEPSRRKEDSDSRRREEERRRRNEDRRRQEEDTLRERDRLAETDRRQSVRQQMADEADRERERLAETDRRQSARQQMVEEASRERHRQAAAAALEGQQRQKDPLQQQLASEYAQMARERAAAATRQRDSDQQDYTDSRPYGEEQRRSDQQRYVDDPQRRDPDIRSRYPSARDSTTAARPRRMTGDTLASNLPISTRSPISARSAAPAAPVVHQYPSARHSGTISERGADVILREQARAAADRPTSARGGIAAQDPYEEDEYDLVDDYYVDANQHPRQRRRPGERRPQQFWQ